MKQQFAPRKTRALAPLLVATALVSTPVFAQDTTPQAAPATPAASQPVVTPPNSATVPIPPVVRTVPDSSTTTTPTTAASDAEAPAPRIASPARTARTTATRTVTRTRNVSSRASTTSAPAPIAAPAPAPEAAVPAAQPATPPVDATVPVAAPAPQPAAPAADSALSSQSTTTATSGVPLWAWIAGGIALLAAILGAALAMRGRRRDDMEYEEPAYVEDRYVDPQPEPVVPVAETPLIAPVPVVEAAPRKEPEYLRRAAPVAEVEPVVAAPDEVEMSTPPADEIAALTAGAAPVAERPWLEFAMRPVRVGTNVDEALVEIELTVGNAGSIAARNVRISTFLLSSDPNGSEMERLLVDPPAEATTDAVTIKPGEGKRIDATLALLKADMGENLPEAIRPIVVADARYTLEDGSEGRTSAAFVVGVTPEEGGAGLEPLELRRASMHDNVGAELRGEPQHV